MTNKDLRSCRGCNKEHSVKNLKRSLGKESIVVLLGFCSAQCYTESITKIPWKETINA